MASGALLFLITLGRNNSRYNVVVPKYVLLLSSQNATIVINNPSNEVATRVLDTSTNLKKITHSRDV